MIDLCLTYSTSRRATQPLPPKTTYCQLSNNTYIDGDSKFQQYSGNGRMSGAQAEDSRHTILFPHEERAFLYSPTHFQRVQKHSSRIICSPTEIRSALLFFSRGERVVSPTPTIGEIDFGHCFHRSRAGTASRQIE